MSDHLLTELEIVGTVIVIIRSLRVNNQYPKDDILKITDFYYLILPYYSRHRRKRPAFVAFCAPSEHWPRCGKVEWQPASSGLFQVSVDLLYLSVKARHRRRRSKRSIR
jgi:hypothetical protein